MLPAPQPSNVVLDAVRDAAGFLYHLWPTKLAEKHALRRARVQPCRAGQRPMRALAPEVRAFLDSGRLRPKYLFCRLPKQGDFCRRILKSIPQRLRPSFAYGFTARLNPCPSFDEFSASCKTRACRAIRQIRLPAGPAIVLRQSPRRSRPRRLQTEQEES